jgi:hypothetical protein
VRRTAVALTALGAALVAAPLAAGAPTSLSSPGTSGLPRYHGKLTCSQGNWSPDAQSFSYSWQYAGGGSEVATGPTLRPEAYLIGHDVVCVVTATDASGGSTSASSQPVRITPGRTTMRLKAKKVQHKKVTLTGRVGPKEAVRKSDRGTTASLVGYRVNKGSLTQLFGKETLKKNGRFKIVAPDEPGKHTYKVDFYASEPGLFEHSERTVTVTLKKR